MESCWDLLSDELGLRILSLVPFGERPSCRLVCQGFARLISPRICMWKDLIGQEVIGIVRWDPPKHEIWESLPLFPKRYLEFPAPLIRKLNKEPTSSKYDGPECMFFLLLKDPNFYPNTTLRNYRVVAFIRDNLANSCCYITNWRLKELDPALVPTLPSNFEYLGQRIQNLRSLTPTDWLFNHIDLVSEGWEYQREEGEDPETVDRTGYTSQRDLIEDWYIWIELETKTIRLGINQSDTHYPLSIWKEL